MLSRVQPNGWVVGGARMWCKIKKYRMGRATHADTHNVLGLALAAREAGCDVVTFSRDIERDSERREAIEEGIRRVPTTLPAAPAIVGGAAVPSVEGWILALLGERSTESLSLVRAQETLTKRGLAAKDGVAMVRVVEDADLAKVPGDAISLAAWLQRARSALPLEAASRSDADR